MKRFIILLILSLLLLPVASAQVMRQLNVSVDIQEDDLSDVEISFRFTEEIKQIDFPFSGDIQDLKTEKGECIVKKDIRNVLQCKPPSPFMVGEVTITTNFKGSGLTERRGNITYFSFDIPILWETDKVSVIVKLPDGMILTEEVLLPTSPSGVKIGSDGRRILTTWSFTDKNPGDVIPIRIYYEPLIPRPVEKPVYGWMVALILVVVVGIIFIYRRVSKRSELILSVLNESERMIVDIIKKEGKEKVDQRKIVSLSGFSKAKVSRIIQSLVGRGVVKVERIGRRNRVSLRKIVLKE